MISYEDLCAALESFSARARGGTAPARDADPPTTEVNLPPGGGLRSRGGGEDDSTHVGDLNGGPVQPIYEDRSNELDLGDVMADDDLK
jgi:hypothetical protein